MTVPRSYNVAATQKRMEIIEIAKGLRDTPMCEDYEKMVSGMLYDPYVPVLVEARHRARGRAADFNNLDTQTVCAEKLADVRLTLLKKLVGKVGNNTFVEPPFLPDYGCNISIGKDTFINWGMTVLDTSIVVIGDRVKAGPNVSLLSAGHDTSVLSRRKLVEFGHPIMIGDDCWIGANVIILPGVSIGQGCTIGAGSVVTKNIPPFSVAYGNPCRVQKTIASAEEEENDPTSPYHDMGKK